MFRKVSPLWILRSATQPQSRTRLPTSSTPSSPQDTVGETHCSECSVRLSAERSRDRFSARGGEEEREEVEMEGDEEAAAAEERKKWVTEILRVRNLRGGLWVKRGSRGNRAKREMRGRRRNRDAMMLGAWDALSAGFRYPLRDGPESTLRRVIPVKYFLVYFLIKRTFLFNGAFKSGFFFNNLK